MSKRNKWQLQVAFDWRCCLATFVPFPITALVMIVFFYLCPDQAPEIETFPDGSRRFFVQSLHSVIGAPIIFGTLIGSFVLISYLFRKPLIAEVLRNHADYFERSNASGPIAKAISKTFYRITLGFLAVFLITIFVFGTVVLPYREIRLIELHEDRVILKSWYAEWSYSPCDIARVKKHRYAKAPRDVFYWITIALRDGRELRTGELTSRPASGSLDDQLQDAFFTELVQALENPPTK